MSLLPPATSLVDSQKLGHFNEAFLLRHFRKSLAPWVRIHLCGSIDSNLPARRVQFRYPFLSGRGGTSAVLSAFTLRMPGHISTTPLPHYRNSQTTSRGWVSRAMH